MWAGIAGAVVNGGQGFEVALSIHDSVYNTDFSSAIIPYTSSDPTKNAADIASHVLQTIKKFSQEHLCKFLGAGVTLGLLKEARAPSISFTDIHPYILCPVSQPLYSLVVRD
jgi:hypothetical protein